MYHIYIYTNWILFVFNNNIFIEYKGTLKSWDLSNKKTSAVLDFF